MKVKFSSAFIKASIFTLEIEISGDTVFFQYLTSRGEAYGKKIKTELKRIDKE